MIKVAGRQRVVRECTAPFEHNDKDGNVVTTEIKVRYIAPTMYEIRAERDRQIERGHLLEKQANAADASVAAAEKANLAAEALRSDPTNNTLSAAFDTAAREAREALLASRDAAKATAMVEPVWISKKLAGMLESLPDLGDEKGKPFEISAENLENLALANLEAIEKAIDEDIDPKSQPEN